MELHSDRVRHFLLSSGMASYGWAVDESGNRYVSITTRRERSDGKTENFTVRLSKDDCVRIAIQALEAFGS